MSEGADPDLTELVERLTSRCDALEQRVRKLEQADRARDRSDKLERARVMPGVRQRLPLRRG